MIPLSAVLAGGAIGAVVAFGLGYVLGLKIGWLAGNKAAIANVIAGRARLVRYRGK